MCELKSDRTFASAPHVNYKWALTSMFEISSDFFPFELIGTNEKWLYTTSHNLSLVWHMIQVHIHYYHLIGKLDADPVCPSPIVHLLPHNIVYGCFWIMKPWIVWLLVVKAFSVMSIKPDHFLWIHFKFKIKDRWPNFLDLI